MKELFFFDDWMLRESRGLDRKYGRPGQIKEVIIKKHPELELIRGATKIYYDGDVSKYVTYMDCTQKSDKTRFLVRIESEDPGDWPELQFASGGEPMWKRVKNGSVIMDQYGNPLSCFNMLSLKDTPLAKKGYFINFYRYQNSNGRHNAAIGFSRDGVHIDVDDKTSWIPYFSDTTNPAYYDPGTGQFIIYCRPGFVDRRVAIVTSADLRTFSEPIVVIQPDSEDPVGREFYGMEAVSVGDGMHIGILSIYDTEPTEKAWPKMQGVSNTYLAYGHNAYNWYRGSREPFLARTGAGTPFGGQVYCGPPILFPDNTWNFGVMGSAVEHGVAVEKDVPPEWKQTWKTYQYRLRLDGFAYLRTRARLGMIQTKAVIPDGGEMTVNARTAISGHVKVAALDEKTLEPIENFTLDDSVPVKGDELFGKVCWRNRDNLDELKGRPVIFEVRLKEGELYALRFSYRMPIVDPPAPEQK